MSALKKENATQQSRKKTKIPQTKKTNIYFSSVTEQAILDYVSTKDMKTRTELYINHIQPAFNEMVDKIVYTYKFTSLPNIEEFKDECKIFLVTILQKYDINRGSKAFSYFSVITKNWFIHKTKKISNTLKKETSYEDLQKTSDFPINANLVTYNTYAKDRENNEFWKYLKYEVESWNDIFERDNETKVHNAVLDLMDNVDNIEIINKKAVYLYMREITDMNTKQIASILKKMKKLYGEYKHSWDHGNI